MRISDWSSDVCSSDLVGDAVVFLKDVASGKDWGASEGVPEIDNVKCEFDPHVQVIREGEIDVVNTDPVLHNTHGFYGRRTAFNLALPNQGQRIKADLTRPGLVRRSEEHTSELQSLMRISYAVFCLQT